MKKLPIVLPALLLMMLAACSNAPEISFSESQSANVTVKAIQTDPGKTGPEGSFSQNADNETETDTQERVEEDLPEETEAPAEYDSAETVREEPSSSQAVNDPPTDETKEKGSGTPEPEEKSRERDTPSSESKPVEVPPQESTASQPETGPASTSAPETEPVSSFDIDYWIRYAKGYAQKVGLILNPEAAECWDNPTDANAGCIYLERDLSGRLNRYAGDEDITDVWIWYEDLGGGEYLIYIGYA